MLTAFPNGASSFGIPMVGAGQVPASSGKYWFVDQVNGSDGNDGRGMTSAFQTITQGVSKLSVNDVLCVLPGSYNEAVSVAVAGTHIIGLGSAVKQVQWTSPTDTKTLSLGAQGIEVAGFYFRSPTYTAGVPASISLSNAPYAKIHHNRFQGQSTSYYGIYSSAETSDNVTISDNTFIYFNTGSAAAIYTVTASGLSYSAWNVLNNYFSSNINNLILAGARACLIKGNIFAVGGVTSAGAVGVVTTLSINLSGTSSGANMVTQNQLDGAYSATLYKVGAADDNWMGNNAIAGTGVTYGVTFANPT